MSDGLPIEMLDPEAPAGEPGMADLVAEIRLLRAELAALRAKMFSVWNDTACTVLVADAGAGRCL